MTEMVGKVSFQKSYYISLCLCVCVCGGCCYGTVVKIRGQHAGVQSFHHMYPGGHMYSRDQTQPVRIVANTFIWYLPAQKCSFNHKDKEEGAGEMPGRQEYFLLFQGIQICFPTPLLGCLHLPVTPALYCPLLAFVGTDTYVAYTLLSTCPLGI